MEPTPAISWPRRTRTPPRHLLGGAVRPGSRGRLPCSCPAPKWRTHAPASRLRFDLPSALWQDRHEMRRAFIRAVPSKSRNLGRPGLRTGLVYVIDALRSLNDTTRLFGGPELAGNGAGDGAPDLAQVECDVEIAESGTGANRMPPGAPPLHDPVRLLDDGPGVGVGAGVGVGVVEELPPHPALSAVAATISRTHRPARVIAIRRVVDVGFVS
jgi:hypothetical protein